jgi:predicted DNA-binding protein
MRRKARNSRVRLQPYVPDEVSKRLEGVCASANVTESAYVTEALQRHMDGTGDMTLLLRRMDRLGRAVARLHRDLQFHSEAFGLFVRHSLALEANVPEQSRDEMQARAEGRYKQFLEHVIERFSGGHRFLDDLPHEVVANDTELDEIRVNMDGSDQQRRH